MLRNSKFLSPIRYWFFGLKLTFFVPELEIVGVIVSLVQAVARILRSLSAAEGEPVSLSRIKIYCGGLVI